MWQLIDSPFERRKTYAYRFEKPEKKCKSCSGPLIESILPRIPMSGNQEYKPGSKTVVNCTNCYSGEGKHAIPVTPIDTHDITMVRRYL